MSNQPVLCIQIDEEIQLRLIEVYHAEAYLALAQKNKEHLKEWVAMSVYDGTVEAMQAFLKQRLLNFASGEGYHLGIWYQGKIAGLFNYTNLDWRNRKVELGYWIDAELQGKGIVTKACRTMIGYAFEEHLLNKVEIICAVDNLRSRAIPHRLGFTQEGIHRQADKNQDRYDDVAFYGLLADEWRARSRPETR